MSRTQINPAQRKSGFFCGTISSSTFGTTGNKSVTGVGFKPKQVKFTFLPTTGTFSSLFAIGYMNDAGTQYANFTVAGAGGYAILSSQTECLVAVSSNGGSTTKIFSCSYVSMDSDGFTFNVATALNAYNVVFEAYA